MKVYKPEGQGRKHHLYIQPGNHVQGSRWMDEEGKPKMFTVEFGVDGSADVDEVLGQYLIDFGMAKRTNLILPKGP